MKRIKVKNIMQRKSFKQAKGGEEGIGDWSGVNSNKERLKIFTLFMFSQRGFAFILHNTTNICMWRCQRRP